MGAEIVESVGHTQSTFGQIFGSRQIGPLEKSIAI
jgi:hypothetical protein